MRPPFGGDAPQPRSRKASVGDHVPAGPGIPTTFFLCRESEMESSRCKAESRHQDSTFGVQSLEDAIGAAFGENSDDEDGGAAARINRESRKTKAGKTPTASVATLDTKRSSGHSTQASSPIQPHARRFSHASTTEDPSPVYTESPAPNSALPSSPRSTSAKSLQLSDEESVADDVASQAIASSEEDEDVGAARKTTDSAVQLVMPSIKMPSRRPFTDKGKRMGRLKVLVAGKAGVGKTSLINAIVRTCEDVVHVDPVYSDTPATSSTVPRSTKGRRKSTDTVGTKSVAEISASTRAYPSWWSDLEDSKLLRRRRSSGEAVLERNLCFVDTPGYGGSEVSAEYADASRYVVSQLQRNASLASMPEAELLSVLSGNGGCQVDVVLYVFAPEHDGTIDVALFDRLSKLTNVMPVIGKSDLLSQSQISSLKSLILRRLKAEDVRPFLFARSIDDAIEGTEDSPPYAVSSGLANDMENMDASLLMSSEYVQPLVESELATLVAQLFDPDNIVWLRHSAVKKFLQWRSSAIHATSVLYPSPSTPLYITNSMLSSSGSSSLLSSRGMLINRPYALITQSQSIIDATYPAAPSHQLARLSGNARREYDPVQLYLDKQADDLRRSLEREFASYEGMCGTNEVNRLEDAAPAAAESNDKTMLIARRGLRSVRGRRPWQGGVGSGLDRRDPLGILEWEGEMRRRLVWVAKVAGGFGVLGALLVWAARSWGFWGAGEGQLGMSVGGGWSGSVSGSGMAGGAMGSMGGEWWRGLRP